MRHSMEEICEKFLALSPEERCNLLLELNSFEEKGMGSKKDLAFGTNGVIMRVVKMTLKGAATGAGIAGIVDTAVPGLIPTFCGYLVGKGFGDLLVRSGLITLGIFASSSVNSIAVLGLASVLGAVIGSLLGFVMEMRSVRRRRMIRRDLRKRNKVNFGEE